MDDGASPTPGEGQSGPIRQLAMIAHPMWLIIKEDRLCAEATPPWGAESLDAYAERIRRNLAMIENEPQVVLNCVFR